MILEGKEVNLRLLNLKRVLSQNSIIKFNGPDDILALQSEDLIDVVFSFLISSGYLHAIPLLKLKTLPTKVMDEIQTDSTNLALKTSPDIQNILKLNIEPSNQQINNTTINNNSRQHSETDTLNKRVFVDTFNNTIISDNLLNSGDYYRVKIPNEEILKSLEIDILQYCDNFTETNIFDLVLFLQNCVADFFAKKLVVTDDLFNDFTIILS